MSKGLSLNIGKTSFNTTLLVDIDDNTDIAFGDIWTTETILYTDLNFTLNIEVFNFSDVSKDVFLKIYSDDSTYGGTVSPYTITTGNYHTFTFTDSFTESRYRTIRIEAWIGEVNYESTNFVVFIYSDIERILTNNDVRHLTTTETRVVV